ncbi:MAG: HAMP domain-containing histidine kinase [Nitrospirae bacterium]|nr:HAMP domain-containing histidine kinase [Nitrospirota bacterium]
MDRDVTKKKEYEDALKAAINTAKEAAQLKSDFLSSVSHELRTPLTSILGFTMLLKESLNDYIFPKIVEPEAKLTKKMKHISEALDIMENESTRLTALINDVLDIAKIEAGKIEWSVEAVDIIEVFDKSIEPILPQIKEKGIELKKEIIGENFIIIGDQNRLIQAISNIFNNAIKFTDHGNITYKIKSDLYYLLLG